MEIFSAPRGNGGTIKAIKMAKELNGYLVVMNRSECMRVAGIAWKEGINIVFPITFDEFLNYRYHRSGIKCFIIDNADTLLQYIAGRIPVAMATVTADPRYDEKLITRIKCKNKK